MKSNTPLKAKNSKIIHRAANLSLVVSCLLFLVKTYAYLLTNSYAVMSDALESIVNVIAAIVALVVIRYAIKPADEDHPYGHGKAEHFSSTFEGGMIFFAAVLIIAQSVVELFKGVQLKELESGMVIVLISALINLALGLYLKSVGKSQKSEALKASSTHVLSDVYTTVGILAGLLLVWATGITWIDPVVAIIVGLNLAIAGFRIVRKSLNNLLDTQNTAELEFLAAAANKVRLSGIIDIHRTKAIHSGRFVHVDAHLVVPEYFDVSRAHELVDSFETQVLSELGFDGELAFHLDPCKKSYCGTCNQPDCPIRVAAFKELIPFSVKSLTQDMATTKHLYHDN